MPGLECRAVGARCARRRPLTMKLPCSVYCSLWFLLLLVAGSLLLLVHLQDVSEMLQHNAGAKSVGAPRWPVKKSQDVYRAGMESSDPEMETGRSTPPLPRRPTPSQLLPDPPVLHPEDATRNAKLPITKRHRKLLLKSGAPSGEEDQQQQQALAQSQESRRQLLREVCAKYHPSVTEASARQVARVFVEDRSGLLYCEVPKAGCSNWKRVLMVLDGSASSTHGIAHNDAHYANRLRRLDAYDATGIAHRLRLYTKVLFVREPFERLVSAFRDKFESPNSYYHPVFGRPIISRYRANATRVALRTGAGVTFREFVQYLLDVRRPVGMDIHWEPVSQLCSPCLVKYDFIGKFENLEDEANFLLRSVGAPSNLTFPDFKDRNPDAERTSSRITQRYFAQLNSSERQRAYDFYYMDYLMFNYPKPFIDLY